MNTRIPQLIIRESAIGETIERITPMGVPTRLYSSSDFPLPIVEVNVDAVRGFLSDTEQYRVDVKGEIITDPSQDEASIVMHTRNACEIIRRENMFEVEQNVVLSEIGHFVVASYGRNALGTCVYLPTSNSWQVMTYGLSTPGGSLEEQTVSNTLALNMFCINALTESIARAQVSASRTFELMPVNLFEEKTLRELQRSQDVRTCFEEYAGDDELLERLIEFAELALIDAEERYEHGISHSQSIIFSGPSGVGKTRLMHMLADAITQGKGNIHDVDFSDVSGAFVGEWASKIDDIFESAFNADPNEPYVIIMDEMDGLVKSGNSGVSSNIGNVLKRKLDQLRDHPNVFFFASTNNIDDIDPVVRAKKRIHESVYINLPDTEQLVAILRKYIEEPVFALIDQNDPDREFALMQEMRYDYTQLAELLDGHSGSDVKELVRDLNKKLFLRAKKEGRQSRILPTQADLVRAVNDLRRRTT